MRHTINTIVTTQPIPPKKSVCHHGRDEHNDAAKALRQSGTQAQRGPDGRLLPKLTDDQWYEILDRIACGELIVYLAPEYGIHPTAINHKALRDETFEKGLKLAYTLAAKIRVEIAFDKLEGGAWSTGDLKRDKAYADFTKWYAGKDGGANGFTDRPLVDQRTVNITVAKDNSEW